MNTSMKKIRALMAASAVLFCAGQAQAASLTLDPTALVQTPYNALSDDLAAASWMNPSNSAEPHSAGIIPVGVQVAFEIAGLSIDSNAPQWALAGASGLPSILPVPRVRLSAGIPFGLDFGYMMSQIPSSNIKISGYEIRMAFGNFIPVPMLEANVRYHSSALTGVPNMEITNKGFAAMVGANLPFVKPYLELGTVKSTSTPSGALSALSTYEKTSSTMVIGAKAELAFFVINLEKSKVGDKDLTTIKLGFEF